MTIPFLGLFKKKSKPAPVAAPAPAPIEKPSSERFSKTVMPNAARTFTPSAPAAAAPQAIAQTPAPPRSVSFNAPAPRTRELPPAVALALEPRVERAVSLQLSEVVAHMPPGFVRALEGNEGERTVLLKASELERGMANGRPAVAVAAIYEQVPDIFIRPALPRDPTQVQLPFQSVLEQFTKLQVRSDQHREQVVPQVETPFLRVTLEDDSKFGTSIGPVQTTPAPPVRLEPATAETIAAAEPEATAREVCTAAPRPAIRLTVPPESNGKSNGHAAAEPTPAAPTAAAPSAAAASPAPAAAPARIPFKLSPKGTDAPAEQRVPASGGPSVPTSSGNAAPARVPFKLSSASCDEQPATPAEPWLTKDSEETVAAPEKLASVPTASAKAETKITLPLRAVMQMLTPFQVIGDANSVPADARVHIPFALVEPQLATGRVHITPDQFAAALPAEFAGMFDARSTDAPVLLPLQEVLKNLPIATLRMREDQVEQEQGSSFATPFSAKAEEDAQRFKVAATPVPKPVVLPPPAADPQPPDAKEEEPTAPPPRIVKFELPPPAEQNSASTNGQQGHNLAVSDAPSERNNEGAPPPQVTDGTNTVVQQEPCPGEELDGKAAVELIAALPGVTACALMFRDGLSLAGQLPDEYNADGLCAMAPSFMQRIENHMVETKLGDLRTMTLSCSRGAITFLLHDNLCLAALHVKDDLTSDVRERLAHIVHQVSKKYSHAA
jgi:predicted regulator of Ras-like GTPase activity (Roadblock/LC7/MglB family)